ADILQAVEQLDKECRSVYVLYMAGLSVRQISERVNTPENETEKIIKKAGKQLETALSRLK
ncbi:MAG: sigma-70 family RNA polymerase sigma factor, partial [Bacteroidaceae bacterium]|nr:sigma-70 family RNA polymerase sigma factor [Bacteroidaceae bacterium]